MHLNLEGTKHEKAVLVILSYVVGFTAGFIVFGVTQTVTQPIIQTVVVPPAESSVEAVPAEEVVTAAPEVFADQTTPVLYQDGRLMANVSGASVLLSAQLATVDAETAKVFANQGVHEAIPNYQPSEDGNYIYYCEQHSSADVCINFIYSVTDQVIQYVTLDGVKIESTSAEAKTAIWNGEILELGSARSISPETPWKLVSSQQQ
jgi:hypothetical protein